MLDLPAALLCGALLGALNGALVAFVRLPPFIVTLGAMTTVRGVARLIGNGTTVFNANPSFAFIGNGSLGLVPRVLSVPWLAAIAASVVAVCWFVLCRTVFSVQVYATGGNETAARLSGVRVGL